MSAPRTERARLLSEVVGVGLRDARVAAGLSQTKLAARLGTVPPYVSAVEAGRTQVSPEQISRWCAALSVDPSTIYPEHPCPHCGSARIDWAELARRRGQGS